MRLSEDNIADYAHTLVEQVRAGGQILDYSDRSVRLLEELIRLSDEALRSPELPLPQRDLALFYNGCYLGEVIARNLGGVWRFEEAWPDSSIVITRLDGTGVQIFPFQKMYRRLTEPPADNDLKVYYDGLKNRLDIAEPTS